MSIHLCSFDGGGVRGLISARCVQRVEENLGSPLAEHTDYFAGSSTGAIMAAGLSIGLRAEEILKLYQTQASAIFPDSLRRRLNRVGRLFSEGFSAPKYDDEGLITVLKPCFSKSGRAIKLGALKVPTMITAYDVIRRQPAVFKSWKNEQADLPVWELIKASCSAPTYFPAHCMSFDGLDYALIDGGVVANNPGACLVASVIKHRVDQSQPDPLSELTLASFGTGKHTRSISAKEAVEWGALEWIGNSAAIIDVLFDGNADATQYMCRQMFGHENYFQFQMRLSSALDDMDDASRTNTQALLNLADEYLDQMTTQDRIARLCASLKSNAPEPA